MNQPAAKPKQSTRWRFLSAMLWRWAGGPVLTILVSTFIIFIALALAPGDPVAQILDARSTPEQREALRVLLGLDDPLLVRYAHWVAGAVQGDFGMSFAFRQPVTDMLLPRVATTLSLALYAALIVLIWGIGLGSIGGMSKRFRPIVNVIISMGVAVPAYVISLVLVGIFAVGLGWFPTIGAGTGLLDGLWHLTLPAIALAISWTAYVAQITSTAIQEEVSREHVMTARARGLPAMLTFRRHIFRNALNPILTASGLAVAGLVAGSVVVESAFAVEGMGLALVKSVSGKDYAMAMAISLIIVATFVVVMTIVDFIQYALDPRRSQA